MTEETNPHKHQEERLRTLLQTDEKVQPRAGLFSKVWHSKSKYRRVIYQCNSKFKHKCIADFTSDVGTTSSSDNILTRTQPCSTPHLYEPEIQQKFLQAFARCFGQREAVPSQYSPSPVGGGVGATPHGVGRCRTK